MASYRSRRDLLRAGGLAIGGLAVGGGVLAEAFGASAATTRAAASPWDQVPGILAQIVPPTRGTKTRANRKYMTAKMTSIHTICPGH